MNDPRDPIERNDDAEPGEDEKEEAPAGGSYLHAHIACPILRKLVDLADDPSSVLPWDVEKIASGRRMPDDLEAHVFGRLRWVRLLEDTMAEPAAPSP